MQIKSSRFHLFCLEKIFQNKKEQEQDKGVVLVTVLVCVLLLSLIAGALLGLMTNQARIAEHQIRRIRGFYSAWAGLVDNFERLRRNEGIQNTPDPNFLGRNVATTQDPSSPNQYRFQATYSP